MESHNTNINPAETAYQATHDELTGLLNRRGLENSLDQLTHEMPGDFSVSFIDLDGLKQVNDTQGHAAGDLLIRNASDVLAHSTRTADAEQPRPHDVVSLARIGGDEFVLLFPGVNDQEKLNIIQNRIQNNLQRVGIKASIDGKPHEHGERAKDLLDAADQKMMRNKAERKRQEFEALPRRKQLAAKLGTRALRYAGMNPPRQ